MVTQWIQLGVMLVLILIAAQSFSNALEYLSHKLNLSEGVAGSILAAVATALPETSIPILALFAGTTNKTLNEDISIGAILGAPLMLSTLSMFCLALSALKKRGVKGYIKPERSGYERDMDFFILTFLVSLSAMYFMPQTLLIRVLYSMFLVGLYMVYLYLTLKSSKRLVAEGHGIKLVDPLFITKIGLKNNLSSIILQLIFSLGLLIVGAKGFISGVEHISEVLQISALILSFIIVPLATELPEKVNSILWVSKNKDTLGVGNITGALIFQNSLLPALGILFTPWVLTPDIIPGLIITAMAATWLRLISTKGGLAIKALFINGALYFSYLYCVLR